MFDAAHLKSIDGFNSITDCLKLLTCADPSPDCHLRECKKCPDSGELREKLQVLLDEEMVDSVTFNQWESADRCNIFTKSSPTEDFIDDFTDKVEALVTLHFIFKEQVSFLNQLKQDLELNEMIVVGDFAENYSFVVQDSAQGFYFSSGQATIRPFSVYYKEPRKMELKQVSFAAISDCMDHSTVTVYAFQEKSIRILKTMVPDLIKDFLFLRWLSSAVQKQKQCLQRVVSLSRF